LALGTASIVAAAWVPAANAAPSAIPVSPVVAPAPEVEPAAEIAAIEQLKQNYFTDVDAKDWVALRTLFAPDAVVDTRSSFGPIFPSRDPFIVFTAVTLEALSTHHVGSDPQIMVTSPTTADGVWQLQDHLDIGNLIGIHGFASYSDTYEEIGDTWVVASSTLNRTRLDVVVLPGLANISFTVFDVNSANPVISFISRALQNIVDSTAATPSAAVPTSAPASTKNLPAAQAASASTANKVKLPAAPKAASIAAAKQVKQATTVNTKVTDPTAESSSRPVDSHDSPKAAKAKNPNHVKGAAAKSKHDVGEAKPK
jgi:hypothetical protein